MSTLWFVFTMSFCKMSIIMKKLLYTKFIFVFLVTYLVIFSVVFKNDYLSNIDTTEILTEWQVNFSQIKILYYMFQSAVYSICLLSFIVFFYNCSSKIFKLKLLMESLGIISITVILFGYIYGNFSWDIINLPLFFYGSDDAYFLSIAKNILDGNSFWFIKNLDAPFGTRLYDFPNTLPFFCICVRVLGLFTSNVIFITNFYYFLTFLLATLSFYIVLRLFNINYFFSILGSIVFSFSQYHFYRNIVHLNISSFFSTPIVLYVCYCIAFNNDFNKRDNQFTEKLRTITNIITISLLITFSHIYYIYFGCVVIGFSMIWALFKKRYVAIVKSISILFCIIMFVFCDLLPSIIYGIVNTNMISHLRLPYDAYVYSLQLVHLFMPYLTEGKHVFSNITDAYIRSGMSQSEAMVNYLGILSLIGFVILILILLVPSFNNYIRKYEDEGKKGILSFFSASNMLILLLGLQSGIGVIVALLGFTKIRAYNRVSIYILMYSIFALIYIMDILYKKYNKKLKNLYAAIITILLICFHIYETHLTNFVQNQNYNKIAISNVKDYAYKLENLYKNGANILQLPIVSYPENLTNNSLTNCNYQVLPYIYTSNIKYSSGALNNTKEYFAQKVLFDIDDIENILLNAKEYGFDGISVNTDMYNNNSIIDKFNNILGNLKIISDLKNIYLYDIRNYKSNKNFELDNVNFIDDERYIAGGFSILEIGKDFNIRWGTLEGKKKSKGINSYIYFLPPPNKPYKIFFDANSEIDNTLTVYVNNNKIDTFNIHRGENIFETKLINFNNILKPCILKLEHSASFSPKDIDSTSLDGRELTLAYKQIRLK